MKLARLTLRVAGPLLVTGISACAPLRPATPVIAPGSDTLMIPLPQLAARTYRGFEGGLYANGANVPPADHDSAGRTHAAAVRPRDVNGAASASGRYVLLSVGSTNETAAWCSASSAPPCDWWTLSGRATADPTVNHTALVIVNGAAPELSAEMWTSPTSAAYDRIRDVRLAPLGLGEKQVQAAWLSVADPNPSGALPDSTADAYVLVRRVADIVRAMRIRYPNLQEVFLSSAIYGGYVTLPPAGEPYAYEAGFAMKWVIGSQIAEARGAAASSRAGTLSYRAGIAPWIGWGPYLWATGPALPAGSTGWLREDFLVEGTHLSQSGDAKAGAMLFDFFRTSPYARCWFLTGQVC